MSSSLQDTTVELEVLNVFDILDKDWKFLIHNVVNVPPMMIIEITEESAEWARKHIPAKEAKTRPGHFMVVCWKKLTIPLGKTHFYLYLNKGILNIVYRGNIDNIPVKLDSETNNSRVLSKANNYTMEELLSLNPESKPKDELNLLKPDNDRNTLLNELHALTIEKKNIKKKIKKILLLLQNEGTNNLH